MGCHGKKRAKAPKAPKNIKFYAILIAIFALVSGIDRLFTTTHYVYAASMEDSNAVVNSYAVQAESVGKYNADAASAPSATQEASQEAPQGKVHACGRKCLGLAAFDAESGFLVERAAESGRIGKALEKAKQYYLARLQ